jgi:hypothetical protein
MIGWLLVVLGGFSVLAVVANAYFKSRVAHAALRGVPAKDRAAVVDALGRLFGRW